MQNQGATLTRRCRQRVRNQKDPLVATNVTRGIDGDRCAERNAIFRNTANVELVVIGIRLESRAGDDRFREELRDRTALDDDVMSPLRGRQATLALMC